MCVHIKYYTDISAYNAIKEYNGKILNDNITLKSLQANYGTQRYCEF